MDRLAATTRIDLYWHDACGLGHMRRHGQRHAPAQLVEHDLVDECRLMTEPVLLGGGKRVFPDDG